MPVADLDLELDVFAGPFDLLMAVVLREGVNLAEVELGEVVVAYVEHLEETGELDLESATEFLVLIAALLELKSRLLLPVDEEAGRRCPRPRRPPRSSSPACSSTAATTTRPATSRTLFEAGRDHLFRRAPLPPEFRRVSLEAARPVYGGERLAAGDRRPPAHARGARHLAHPPDRLARAAPRRAPRASERRTAIDFDDAFGREDRLTQAVTIFALLEMHKRGEATLGPVGDLRADHDQAARRGGGNETRRSHDRRTATRARDRSAPLSLAGAGLGDRARRGDGRDRGAGRARARRPLGLVRRGQPRPRAAETSRAAGRSRPTRSPPTPRASSSPSRRRRRSRRRRPRRSRSSPTSSRSRGPRSAASAASPASPP